GLLKLCQTFFYISPIRNLVVEDIRSGSWLNLNKLSFSVIAKRSNLLRVVLAQVIMRSLKQNVRN
ncbi:MAG: hypothetical protein WCE93_12890, partial [Nitrososphaeraceae archaeon]